MKEAAKRRRPPLSLLPEMARVLWRRAMTPFRVAWRRNWFYRRLLKGRMPDGIRFHPYDALPRRLEDADALLRGRYRFAGESVDAKERSIFAMKPPSRDWAEALHGFDWLPPLSAAGGDPARDLAADLLGEWIAHNPRYSEPAWYPQVAAARLVHVFAHGRFVLSNSEVLWRSRVLVFVREQSRLLARIAGEAPDGLPRFAAAATHALSGACLDDSVRRLESGLARLEAEIARQILPDGGHVSRAPETLAHAYRHLVMVMDALTAIGYQVPAALRNAHDRMAPMLRFFRHGDGALALFNGGRESDGRMIAGLLARDEVRGQPFAYAPYSGYQRLTAGRALAILDCGKPPQGAFSVDAHAGSLSFEFSAGQQRIVVNCGAPADAQSGWDSALRATAAHSTITLDDTSIAWVLPPGRARNLIGPRLFGGPTEIVTSRVEIAQGWSVEASHDGYMREYGMVHERKLTLGARGEVLIGHDRLVPKGQGKRAVSFALRFHIHPDIRMSPSQGAGILLKLPNGDGWRFRCGGEAHIDESVYLGGDTVRRAEQLVVTGTVKDAPVDIDWVFEQI
ncbi:MAG TPA: heparinase II/III family protein [Rhizomicrobium sp.]|nr:heparinase II/III family protein [Rhizomicrobium sp.]